MVVGRAGGSRGARSGLCGRSFAFPAPAPPPSARTFPGAREVMINSGLALSPPPRVPPGPTPCSAAPFRPGRLGRARRGPRAPLTVNSDSRPPWARLPPPLSIACPAPGPPAACTRAGSTASPISTPAFRRGLCRKSLCPLYNKLRRGEIPL